MSGRDPNYRRGPTYGDKDYGWRAVDGHGFGTREDGPSGGWSERGGAHHRAVLKHRSAFRDVLSQIETVAEDMVRGRSIDAYLAWRPIQTQLYAIPQVVQAGFRGALNQWRQFPGDTEHQQHPRIARYPRNDMLHPRLQRGNPHDRSGVAPGGAALNRSPGYLLRDFHDGSFDGWDAYGPMTTRSPLRRRQ